MRKPGKLSGFGLLMILCSLIGGIMLGFGGYGFFVRHRTDSTAVMAIGGALMLLALMCYALSRSGDKFEALSSMIDGDDEENSEPEDDPEEDSGEEDPEEDPDDKPEKEPDDE